MRCNGKVSTFTLDFPDMNLFARSVGGSRYCDQVTAFDSTAVKRAMTRMTASRLLLAFPSLKVRVIKLVLLFA
jgi:hypothetical protein